MTCKSAYNFSFFKVPKFDGTTCSSGDDYNLCCIKSNRFHCTGVTCQTQYSIRFANSPHVNFVILPARDQDPGGLLSNFEAVDIGRVRNKFL